MDWITFVGALLKDPAGAFVVLYGLAKLLERAPGAVRAWKAKNGEARVFTVSATGPREPRQLPANVDEEMPVRDVRDRLGRLESAVLEDVMPRLTAVEQTCARTEVLVSALPSKEDIAEMLGNASVATETRLASAVFAEGKRLKSVIMKEIDEEQRRG